MYFAAAKEGQAMITNDPKFVISFSFHRETAVNQVIKASETSLDEYKVTRIHVHLHVFECVLQ